MYDYIRGLNRQQQLLFPERLEDYVSEDAGVRAIDAYVDGAFLRAHASKNTGKKSTPSLSKGKLGFIYRTGATDCKDCPLRSECWAKQTPQRRIWRWEHEAFIQTYRKAMQTASAKAISKRRGAIVEHHFGTIKRSLGWDQDLLRGKEKVSGAYGFDWALMMFCDNFKRVLNPLGTMLFNQLLLAIKAGDIEAVMQATSSFLRPLFDYLCQKCLFSHQTRLFYPLAFDKNPFLPVPDSKGSIVGM